jgi:hypothetical protein
MEVTHKNSWDEISRAFSENVATFQNSEQERAKIALSVKSAIESIEQQRVMAKWTRALSWLTGALVLATLLLVGVGILTYFGSTKAAEAQIETTKQLNESVRNLMKTVALLPAIAEESKKQTVSKPQREAIGQK